jgi:multidrug efflux pump subunit AcrA (membrane-fusion protein)
MATLADLQAELAQLKTARDAIEGGAQSYTISGRSLTRANLKDIYARIDAISARIGRLESGSYAAPIFIQTR